MSRAEATVMTRIRPARGLAALVLAGVCGCASNAVHYVTDTEGGGVVGIPTNSDIWPTFYRSKALELIAAKCPNYDILHEEEVTLPQNDYNAPNDNPRYEYTGALMRLPDPTEYQITFRCRAAPPPPK